MLMIFFNYSINPGGKRMLQAGLNEMKPNTIQSHSKNRRVSHSSIRHTDSLRRFANLVYTLHQPVFKLPRFDMAQHNVAGKQSEKRDSGT
jgi:hypothetical protein